MIHLCLVYEQIIMPRNFSNMKKKESIKFFKELQVICLKSYEISQVLYKIDRYTSFK